jgi:lysophospholipase L1-like esterase
MTPLASLSCFFFACAIVAGVLFGAVFVPAMECEAAANTALEPIPRPDEWWTQRHEEKLAQVREGGLDMIFIGDSITHAWESEGKAVWDAYYGNRNAANLGYSGDQTQHVLWRFANGELDGISPKVAVVMIGTNNVGVNTAEEIAEGVGAVVSALRAKLPATKVLLLSIFPRSDVPQELRDKLKQANALLDEKDLGEDVHRLDIAPWFQEPAGTLPTSVMPDLLHLSARGYQLWAEAIEPKVSELMGDDMPKGWSPLFNGTDLTGWEQIGSESWNVEDGVLYTEGGEGGWLSTDKEYGDMELALEFRVPADGNSGVFIRAPREGNPAFEGFEVQILDDDTEIFGALQPWQLTGSVYAVAAPSRDATLPADTWQAMRIRCEGSRVVVVLNDVPTVNVDLSTATSHAEAHPGLQRTQGYIGLQNHGSRLDFRNIRIRALK